MKKTINFKLFVAVALGLIAIFSSVSLTSAQNLGGGDSTINTLDQWKATSTPISAITQRTFGKPLVLTGYSAGCAQFTATGTLQSTGIDCGSGSGSTSTPSVGSFGWLQFASSSSGYFDATSTLSYSTTTRTFTLGGGNSRLETHAIKGDASDGLLIEANSGTDVGIVGIANTANGLWYGSHNFNGNISASLYTATSTTGTSTFPNISASSTLITSNGLGTTGNDSLGLRLDNNTAATAGQLQYSPAVRFRGQGFFSNSSLTYPFDVKMFSVGEVNTTAYGKFLMQFRANNGTYAEFMRFDSAPLGQGFAITPGQALSNGTPGTTRNFTINNTGSHSWIDFNFSGTRKASFGSNNTGGITFNSADSNIYFTNNFNSLLTQIYSGGIYNSGGSFNQGRLTAGAAQTSPPSTFTNYGSTGLKITKIDTSGTLTGDYTQILADTSGSVCGGTPSNSCGTHSDQTACELYNAHGGCSWFAGSSCSVYDSESGMGTCGSTSGCTVVTSSCTGGDESSCLSNDDAYGGSCAWTEGFGDCTGFDESTCGATTGCSQNFGDCSPYSDGGGDGSACSGYNAGCTYDSGSGSCTGTPYLSCTGSYSLGYSCSGNYNTGSCSGVYGAVCSGTPSCAGVGTGSCTSEAGCSITTGLTLTMPADSADLSRTYWIKKITSGTLTLTANTGQSFYDTGGSTYSTATSGTAIMLSYFRDVISCSALDESTCGSTGGCSQSYSSCSWDSMANTCTGGGSCSGYGDESSCNAATYYSSCSGSYAASKKWYIMSAYKQQ